jgi:hypothetical protein
MNLRYFVTDHTGGAVADHAGGENTDYSGGVVADFDTQEQAAGFINGREGFAILPALDVRGNA